MINILMSRGILASPQVYQKAKNYIKPNMKVLIIYFSYFSKHLPNKAAYDIFYDYHGEYHQKMLNTFATYEISEKNVLVLDYFKDDYETATKKITSVDILYFPGGSPVEMMQRFAEKKILDALQQFKGIIVGSSAGAMIQNDYYHISPDLDFHKFSINQGIGYIKEFGIEVHFRRRLKQKKALRKTANLLDRPIYVIPDDSAVIKDDVNIMCIKNAKLYYQKGKKVR